MPIHTLMIHVQPNAKSTAIVGRHGEAIKIRIAAPALDGRANDLLVDFLADCLAIPRRLISIRQGHSSRLKRLDIEISRTDLEAFLLSKVVKT